jgi:hypothetical protein
MIVTGTSKTNEIDDPEKTLQREMERRALAIHLALCHLAEEARACGLEYAAMLIENAARSCVDSKQGLLRP